MLFSDGPVLWVAGVCIFSCTRRAKLDGPRGRFGLGQDCASGTSHWHSFHTFAIPEDYVWRRPEFPARAQPDNRRLGVLYYYDRVFSHASQTMMRTLLALGNGHTRSMNTSRKGHKITARVVFSSPTGFRAKYTVESLKFIQ